VGNHRDDPTFIPTMNRLPLALAILALVAAALLVVAIRERLRDGTWSTSARTRLTIAAIFAVVIAAVGWWTA
jgi:hypothetical protein